MKSFVCLLILFGLLSTALLGCTQGHDGTPSGSTQTPVSNDDSRYRADVPATRYNGATFTVIGRGRTASWGEMGLFSDGYDGTVLNDAVYDRNLRVAEDYDIDLHFLEVNDAVNSGGVFFQELLTNCSSGDYLADICAVGLIDACSLITQNAFVDLEAVPHVDLSAPWWQQRINQNVRLLNRQYLGFNDMMLNDKIDTYLIYFNKTVFDDYDMDYPYAAVKDGTWTNDKMLTYITGYGADLNGNGTCDPDDKVAYAYLLNDTFYIGAGLTGAKLDEDGYPYITEYSEKIANISDTVKTLIMGSPYNAHVFGDVDTAKAIFDDNGLFLNFGLGYMETIAAVYESDVGIVPCPKYDETQTEYYARAGFNGATCITVLSSTPDLDRAGLLLEVFSAESKNYISPAFYEKLFTDRYTNDEESKEMLSLVIASEIIDLDQVFQWGQLIVNIAAAAGRGTGSATLYQRLAQMAGIKVEDTIENYLTIGQ